MLLKKFTSSFFFIILVSTLHGQSNSALAQNTSHPHNAREARNVVYFAPEIYPAVDEIRSATHDAFFSAVTNRFSRNKNRRMVRVDMPVSFEQTEAEIIREICRNNDAAFAVVPKVKFFKVGLGQFVFSSQVVVSMKLYDAEGKLISENSYDTFKKNARILGSAQNSIKKGTDGVMKLMVRDLKKAR